MKRHTSSTARVSCSIDEHIDGILLLDFGDLFFLQVSSTGSSMTFLYQTHNKLRYIPLFVSVEGYCFAGYYNIILTNDTNYLSYYLTLHSRI
jgi:hypothetical protein